MLQRSRVLTTLLIKKNRWCPTCLGRGLFGTASRRKSGSSDKTKLFGVTTAFKNYEVHAKTKKDGPDRLLRSMAERDRKTEIDLYLKIRSLIQKKKLDEALKLFDEYKQAHEKCTEIFYSKILTAFSRGGSVEGVEKIFTYFMKDNYKPKQEHYDRIIRVYCANQKVEKALQLAKHMVDNGSQLSSETFGWVIELCEKTGNKESADNIFKLFRQSGLPPSESLLRTVLHQRSEAEFEFRVAPKVKSHFNFLKNNNKSSVKSTPASAMPNVNLNSSLKQNNNDISTLNNSSNVKTTNNSTLKTDEGTSGNSTVIPK